MSAAQLPTGTVIQARPADSPDFVRRFANLASEDFGAKVLSCSDEFFAAAQRCLQDAAPVFVVGKFDDNGKWMDGWRPGEGVRVAMTTQTFSWRFQG